MRKQFAKMASAYLCFFIFIIFTASFFLEKRMEETGTETGSRLVLLNEIEQLTAEAGGSNPAAEEFQLLKADLQKDSAKGLAEYRKSVGIFYACLTFFFCAAVCFIFILRF